MFSENILMLGKHEIFAKIEYSCVRKLHTKTNKKFGLSVVNSYI